MISEGSSRLKLDFVQPITLHKWEGWETSHQRAPGGKASKKGDSTRLSMASWMVCGPSILYPLIFLSWKLYSPQIWPALIASSTFHIKPYLLNFALCKGTWDAELVNAVLLLEGTVFLLLLRTWLTWVMDDLGLLLLFFLSSISWFFYLLLYRKRNSK